MFEDMPWRIMFTIFMLILPMHEIFFENIFYVNLFLSFRIESFSDGIANSGNVAIVEIWSFTCGPKAWRQTCSVHESPSCTTPSSEILKRAFFHWMKECSHLICWGIKTDGSCFVCIFFAWPTSVKDSSECSPSLSNQFSCHLSMFLATSSVSNWCKRYWLYSRPKIIHATTSCLSLWCLGSWYMLSIKEDSSLIQVLLSSSFGGLYFWLKGMRVLCFLLFGDVGRGFLGIKTNK